MAKTPQKTPPKGLKPPWKKGDPSPNPNGRPKGQRNFAVIYREALEKIAKTQNMTPEEIEDIMLQSGLKKAIKGDYQFYRDTFDRLHGKPEQTQNLKHSGSISLTKLLDSADSIADEDEE